MSDPSPNSVASRSRPVFARLSSLRFRLLALVLLGVLPTLVLTLYTAAEQRKTAAAGVQRDALRIDGGQFSHFHMKHHRGC